MDGELELVPKGEAAGAEKLEMPRDLALDALDHADYLTGRTSQGNAVRPLIWALGGVTYALLEIAKQVQRAGGRK